MKWPAGYDIAAAENLAAVVHVMKREELDGQTRAELLTVAHELADIARAHTLSWFRNPDLAAANKLSGGFDPVTQADRAAEAALRDHLAVVRPDDGVLGEEFPPLESRTGLTWIIDPIDGTRGFMSGTPCWGVLIALADARGPFLGVIDQPYIGERFLGGLGAADMTWPQGRRALGTRETRELAEAIMFTTFPEIGTPLERAAFERVAAQVKLTRYGMDCYAYALLAAGHVDLVIEAGLNAYDIAAPIAVIEAAGGVVSDWQGGRPGDSGRILAAANPVLHASAMAVLNG